MSKYFVLLLAWMTAVGPATVVPVSAATLRSLFISPGAMNVYPIYRDDVLVPGLLQKSTDTSFRVGFTLPPDYATGTTVQVRLMMQANTSASSCAGMFGVLYFDRARIGYSTYETAPPNFDGLTGGVTATLSFPSAGKVMMKNFSIVAPKHASFTGLNPGDNFLIWVKRYSTNALDTCDFVTLLGAEVRYNAKY